MTNAEIEVIDSSIALYDTQSVTSLIELRQRHHLAVERLIAEKKRIVEEAFKGERWDQRHREPEGQIPK